MDPVAVARAPVGANVNVQVAAPGELPERPRDVLKLGSGDLPILTRPAGSRGNLRLGHSAAVDGLQPPRLQGAAVLADAPRPKLCPEQRWEARVVLRNVLSTRRLDVAGFEELLLDPLAVSSQPRSAAAKRAAPFSCIVTNPKHIATGPPTTGPPPTSRPALMALSSRPDSKALARPAPLIVAVLRTPRPRSPLPARLAPPELCATFSFLLKQIDRVAPGPRAKLK